MAIPVLGIGQGVEERGFLDGHPYVLEIDFEVLMAEIGWWSIVLEHAPSKKPLVEVYNQSADNPIFEPEFRAKALAICDDAVERLRARIAAVRLRSAYPNFSAALTTAGGLMFTGFGDGTLVAYDDESLEPLWKINVGTGFNAPPMTFEAGGKQYVAISRGWARFPRAASSSPQSFARCATRPCCSCSACSGKGRGARLKHCK
jgi:hypothetical protein